LKLLFEIVISLAVDRVTGIVYNVSKNSDKIELKKKVRNEERYRKILNITSK